MAWFGTARTLFQAAIDRLKNKESKRTGAWTKKQSFRMRTRATMLQVNREFKTADDDVLKAALAKLKEMCEFTNEIVDNKSKQQVETAPAGEDDELEGGASNLFSGQPLSNNSATINGSMLSGSND